MHENDDRLFRQQLEQLMRQEIKSEAPCPSVAWSRLQMGWRSVQDRWNGAIAALTDESRIWNQTSHQSGDFTCWYTFSWQAWVYSRLEDNPEAGRNWLEQVYRRSKSDV